MTYVNEWFARRNGFRRAIESAVLEYRPKIRVCLFVAGASVFLSTEQRARGRFTRCPRRRIPVTVRELFRDGERLRVFD